LITLTLTLSLRERGSIVPALMPFPLRERGAIVLALMPFPFPSGRGIDCAPPFPLSLRERAGVRVV